MAKISVRGRERDRLDKKTKAGTLGRMSLALALTLSQPMHSGGGIWRHGTQALPSCDPFQPCRYPEDWLSHGLSQPQGLQVPCSQPAATEVPSIWSSGQLSCSRHGPSPRPCPTVPLLSTAWLMPSYFARQTWTIDGGFFGQLSVPSKFLPVCTPPIF